MSEGETKHAEPNSGFIGEGVIFRGSISAPNNLVIHGVVEGDVAARSVLVGASGEINGSLKSLEAEIHGKLGDSVEVAKFLHLNATSQVEGAVACGDIQIDRDASLKANFSSLGEVANDNTAQDDGPRESRDAAQSPPIAPKAAAEASAVKLAAAEQPKALQHPFCKMRAHGAPDLTFLGRY
jgi:cytoskeletal protein CcmA (bactofilin family)